MDELEKLYSEVSKRRLYTKSFDEFKNDYIGNAEKQSKMYDVLSKKRLYTKSEDEFKQKYFPDLKKKDDTTVAPAPSESSPQEVVEPTPSSDTSEPQEVVEPAPPLDTPKPEEAPPKPSDNIYKLLELDEDTFVAQTKSIFSGTPFDVEPIRFGDDYVRIYDQTGEKEPVDIDLQSSDRDEQAKKLRDVIASLPSDNRSKMISMISYKDYSDDPATFVNQLTEIYPDFEASAEGNTATIKKGDQSIEFPIKGGELSDLQKFQQLSRFVRDNMDVEVGYDFNKYVEAVKAAGQKGIELSKEKIDDAVFSPKPFIKGLKDYMTSTGKEIPAWLEKETGFKQETERSYAPGGASRRMVSVPRDQQELRTIASQALGQNFEDYQNFMSIYRKDVTKQAIDRSRDLAIETFIKDQPSRETYQRIAYNTISEEVSKENEIVVDKIASIEQFKQLAESGIKDLANSLKGRVDVSLKEYSDGMGGTYMGVAPTEKSVSDEDMKLVVEANEKLFQIQKSFSQFKEKALMDINASISTIDGQEPYMNALRKNYNTWDAAVNDFQQTAKNMLYDAVILGGAAKGIIDRAVGIPDTMSEVAIMAARAEKRALERTQEAFATKLTYEEAVALGRKGEFVTREFATQAPYIISAVAAASTGGALGLGTYGTQALIGTTFGVTSAGAKYDEVTTRQEIGEQAKAGLEELESNKATMPRKEYLEQKFMLERSAASNDISDGEKAMSVIGAGIIEGTITSFLGTAPNAMKVVKDFTKPNKIVGDMLRSNYSAAGKALEEIGKRTGGEVIEETSIEGLTMLNDAGWLGDQVDFSMLDDVAITSVISSGPMNIPGIAYSHIMSQTAINKYKSQIRERVREIEKQKLILTNEDLTDVQRNQAHNTINRLVRSMADDMTNAEADAILLGGDNIREMLSLGGLRNTILKKAGVTQRDTYEQANAKVKAHIESLPRDEAEQYKAQLEAIDERRNEIIGSIDYKDAPQRVFGEKGKKMAESLEPGTSPEETWRAVYRQFREEVREGAIREFNMIDAPEVDVITAENSSNYANMTEDNEGNFVFFHRGEKGYDVVEPRVGDSGVMSKEEAAAIGKVGGVAMYYTSPEYSERQRADNARYVVKVPKEKVYDFNNDPLNLFEEGKRRHEAEYPGQAYNFNTQMAYITKIAGERGFDMVVGEWNGNTRAQTTQKLAPVDVMELDNGTVTKPFEGEYKSNMAKGFAPFVPERKSDKRASIYKKIRDYKDRRKEYDELYRLANEEKNPERIVELVEESNIPQELKDELRAVEEAVPEKRRSIDRVSEYLVSLNDYRSKKSKLAEDLESGRIDEEQYKQQASALNKELSAEQKRLDMNNKKAGIETRDKAWDDNVKESLPESDFKTTEELEAEIKDGQWGMLTAEFPEKKIVTDEDNRKANNEAEAWLREKKYKPVRIFGKYGNSENSFFVPGLTMKHAIEFAKRFKQESVATDKGLVFQDGRMHPRTGEEVGVSATDNYSTIRTAEGNVDLSVKYDWGQKVPSGQEVSGPVKIRAFHGTSEVFDEFDMSRVGQTDEGFLGEGIYVTRELENAEEYGDIVMEVDVDLKNPLVIEDPYSFGGVNPNKIREVLGIPKESTPKQVRQALIDQGYDGVIVNEIDGVEGIEIVALYPEQVKRAGEEVEVEEKQGTIDNLREAFDIRPADDIAEVESEAKRIEEALQETSPGIKVVVDESMLVPGTYERLDDGSEVIYVRGDSKRTIAHETFHALMYSGGKSSIAVLNESNNMLNALRRVVDKETQERLDRFAEQYEYDVRPEEWSAELFSIMTSDGVRLNPKAQGIIRQFIDRILKILGIQNVSTTDVVNQMNNLADSYQTGKFPVPKRFADTEADLVTRERLTAEESTRVRENAEAKVIEGQSIETWVKMGKEKKKPVVKFKGEINQDNVREHQVRSYNSTASKLSNYVGLASEIKDEVYAGIDAMTPKQKQRALKVMDGKYASRISDYTNKLNKAKNKKDKEKNDYDNIDRYTKAIKEIKRIKGLKTLKAQYQAVQQISDRVIREGVFSSTMYTIMPDGGMLGGADLADSRSKSVYEKAKETVKANLLAVYNSVDPVVRSISKLWYDGANAIAQDMAQRYNLTLEQSAAIIATQSPQMPWFDNLHLAEAIMDIMTNESETALSQEMIDFYIQKAQDYKDQKKYIPALKKLKGKKLKDLSDYDAAIFIRVYYDMYMDRRAHIRLPNGTLVGELQSEDSSFSGYTTIQKGVSVFRDGSIENIDKSTGDANKVRNFYLNIANPNDPRAVTIDTHAMAIALMKPLASNDYEVDFGPASFSFYADAYRELAGELGIKARELQSITWEAARAIFPKKEKKREGYKEEINDIWAAYDQGAALEDVQSQVFNKGKNPNKTEWSKYIEILKDENKQDNYSGTITRSGIPKTADQVADSPRPGVEVSRASRGPGRPSGTPSIKQVLQKAKELNVGPEDLKTFMEELGYSAEDIGVDGIEEATMNAMDSALLSAKRSGKKYSELKKSQRNAFDQIKVGEEMYAVETEAWNKMVEAAVGDLQSSTWYQIADDIYREMAVRKVRKDLGERIKRAPSAAKVLGKKRKKLVSVDEYAALKDQIRLEAKAAKDAKRDLNQRRNEISIILGEMQKAGKITTSQARVIINKISRVNLDNPKAVENLIKYMDKVYKNAELADYIMRSNKRRSAALKNIRSKIGSGKGIFDNLLMLFSVDARMIPESVIQEYNDLLDMFSARKAVLDLARKTEIDNKATQVLEAISEQADQVPNLALIYQENYDSDMSFEDNVNEMIEKQLITEEEADIMRKYKRDINIRPEAEEKVEEDIEITIRENNIEPGYDRDAAQKFIDLVNEVDISGLTTSEKNNIQALLDNIEAGFFGHWGNNMTAKLESMRDEQRLIDVARGPKWKLPIDRTIAAIKNLMSRNNMRNTIEYMIRQNPLSDIDTVLGNFSNTEIRDVTFGKAAKAYSALSNEIDKVTEKLLAADRILSNMHNFDSNKITESKYRIMLYLLQKEFEANPGSKKVFPAHKAAQEIIDNYRSIYQYNKRDADALKKIVDDLRLSEEGALERLEKSLNDKERKATDLIVEVNRSLRDKAMFVGGVVRGRRPDMIGEYVHHQTARKNRGSEIESVSEKYNAFKNFSTKAGTVEERTAGVKALNLDPITTAMSGARETLTDFHMTMPVKTIFKTLNNFKRWADENGTEEQRDMAQALINSFEDTMNITFLRDHMGDQAHFWSDVRALGYKALLASLPRATAELLSNLGYITTANGIEFYNSGLRKYGKLSMEHDSRDILEALGSESIAKLYGKKVSGRFVDVGAFPEEGGFSTPGMRSQFASKMGIIGGYVKTGYKDAVSVVADKMISSPDKIVSRPLWFGAMASKFKELSGKEIDFDRVTSEEYRRANEKALSEAVRYADQEVTRASSTANPFSGTIRNKTIPGKGNFLKEVNAFMNTFIVNEYTTARAAMYRTDMPAKKRAALLAATGIRMSSYFVLYQIAAAAFDLMITSLMGEEPDEEDLEIFDSEEIVEVLKRQLIGSGLQLILGRNIGQLGRIPIALGVEELNKEYGSYLRDGAEYDSFKDNMFFSPVTMENLVQNNVAESMLLAFAGPYTPWAKTAITTGKYIKRAATNATKSSRQYNKDMAMKRIPVEIMGNLGLVPFYKDVRRIVLDYMYKNFKPPRGRGKKKARSTTDFSSGF